MVFVFLIYYSVGCYFIVLVLNLITYDRYHWLPKELCLNLSIIVDKTTGESTFSNVFDGNVAQGPI